MFFDTLESGFTRKLFLLDLGRANPVHGNRSDAIASITRWLNRA